MRSLWTVAALLLAAFGATVAGSAAAAESAFRKVVYARGIDAPVLLTHAPGEPRTVYVVEQSGRVIRLRSGRRTVYLDPFAAACPAAHGRGLASVGGVLRMHVPSPVPVAISGPRV